MFTAALQKRPVMAAPVRASRRRPVTGHRRGFTHLGVRLAIAVLGIGLAAIPVALMRRALRRVDAGVRHARAGALAGCVGLCAGAAPAGAAVAGGPEPAAGYAAGGKVRRHRRPRAAPGAERPAGPARAGGGGLPARADGCRPACHGVEPRRLGRGLAATAVERGRTRVPSHSLDGPPARRLARSAPELRP